MPVLDALPHITIIRGLKGILDFYYWKGIPCVRKWPVIPPSSRSPASLASATLFGAISQGYALLGGALKTLFTEDAADHNRTGRDLYISATLGHLHEASMSDFLDLLTLATQYLEVIKELSEALQTRATDRLLVTSDTELPAPAALADTAANPTTPTIGAAQLAFNGTTWERVRANEEFTVLPMALRTTTITTPTQYNPAARGLLIFLNITDRVGDETITPNLVYLDPVNDTYFYAGWMGVIDAAGQYGLIVYPGATTVTTHFQNFIDMPVPRRWRLIISHLGTGSMTYSVGACHIMA